MAVTDVISYLVIGFVAFRLVSGARVARSSEGRSLSGEIVGTIRWRHVWPVPLVLGTVIGVATLLVEIPGLSWGWWTALGGDGNPVFGSTESTTGTVAEWLVPLLMMVLLVPALPLFAHAEERIFRTGAERWGPGRRLLKTLGFGLVHAVIGIPIGAALALSIGGAYFMGVYLRAYRRTGSSRGSTIESAAAHTAYNGVIVAIVLVVIVWTML